MLTSIGDFSLETANLIASPLHRKSYSLPWHGSVKDSESLFTWRYGDPAGRVNSLSKQRKRTKALMIVFSLIVHLALGVG